MEALLGYAVFFIAAAAGFVAISALHAFFERVDIVSVEEDYWHGLVANKARQLLEDCLTPQQARELSDQGWFTVIGGRSGEPYEIHTDRLTFNIARGQGAARVHLCCAVDVASVAPSDLFLAQKIMLETCEDEVLGVANVLRPDPKCGQDPVGYDVQYRLTRAAMETANE